MSDTKPRRQAAIKMNVNFKAAPGFLELVAAGARKWGLPKSGYIRIAVMQQLQADGIITLEPDEAVT